MTFPSNLPPKRDRLVLVSHGLCPYVQRAAIVASEAGVRLERIVIDLANKPEWFLEYSPTGKVPLLLVGDVALFESAAIAEYLNEISHAGMLPQHPAERARHRAWIEFASVTLAQIAGLYSAPDREAFDRNAATLRDRFDAIGRTVGGRWFGGREFGLVDAAFAPVFRYLDIFEQDAGIWLMPDNLALRRWRRQLAERPSVKKAVVAIYPDLLRDFFLNRGSYLSTLMAARQEVAA